MKDNDAFNRNKLEKASFLTDYLDVSEKCLIFAALID